MAAAKPSCSETGKECEHYTEDLCPDHSKCVNFEYKPEINSSHKALMNSATGSCLAKNNLKTVCVMNAAYSNEVCEHKHVCNLRFISYNKKSGFLCEDGTGRRFSVKRACVVAYEPKVED
jgi:hypothetical protein